MGHRKNTDHSKHFQDYCWLEVTCCADRRKEAISVQHFQSYSFLDKEMTKYHNYDNVYRHVKLELCRIGGF